MHIFKNNENNVLSTLMHFDNSDVGADELVQAVPQPKEMESMSYSFSLQQLFASGNSIEMSLP
jgi:hypothetical protein